MSEGTKDRVKHLPYITKAQREYAAMYSPFTEPGPRPLPRHKVPPHACSHRIIVTRDSVGNEIRVDFRK